MRSFQDIIPLRAHLDTYRSNERSIGLVPTMGALHSGHEELIRTSLSENDCTVVSIFVNAAQFNNREDFNNYPITSTEDSKLLEALDCDVAFIPKQKNMYPTKASVNLSFGGLETLMEGRYRPGHFSGVGLVVSKLFNIVQPDSAYFGQKDLQQCAVIRQLCDDLNFPVGIKIVPTVREPSGPALSSRNLRLSADEREKAKDIYALLREARHMLLNGDSPRQVRQLTIKKYEEHPVLNLEYFEIVSSDTLMPVERIASEHQVSLCAAAYIGEVRLIDNIYLFEEDDD